MRGIIFLIALLSFYWISRRHSKTIIDKSLAENDIAALILVSFIVIIALRLAFQAQIGGGESWPTYLREILDSYVPLDAAFAGTVLGYLLADQQTAAERLAEKHAKAAIEAGIWDVDKNDINQSSDFSRLVSVAKSSAFTIAATFLAVTAVIPSSIWTSINARLTNVEAAGIKLTLSAVASRDIAQSIRSSGVPRDDSSSGGSVDRFGFNPNRLERMESLTYPPKQVQVEILGRPYFSSEIPSITVDPKLHLLVSQSQDPVPTQIMPTILYQIQRDRALALLLSQGSAAGTLIEEGAITVSCGSASR